MDDHEDRRATGADHLAGALVLLLLAQYPPERPPLMPVVPILWMIVPATAADLPPAPPGQPVTVLWIFPANTASGQAEADARCAEILPWNNTVLGNDPANPTRLQQVGCLYYPGYTSTTMSADLSWLSTNAAASALRNQYQADQMQMASIDGTSCGLGYIGAGKYGKVFSASVVFWPCAKDNFSSVHEMGHNYGVCHDDPNAVGCTPVLPDGYGFCDSAHGRRDPMVYPSPCGGTRVEYFGNPDIQPFGYPFGDLTHNAAHVIRDQMPRIANFYPPVSNHRPSTLTSLSAVQ